MPRNPPVRMSAPLGLMLDPSVIERAKKAAAHHGLSTSGYIAALICGEPIVARPAAQIQDIALIANRIASALAYLTRDPSDVLEAVRVLRDGAARCAAIVREEIPAYDAAVKAQVAEDGWNTPS